MKSSWKTTLCGALAALGAFLVNVPDPAWVATVGKVLVGVATAALGFFARDNDKTSNDVGAGK